VPGGKMVNADKRIKPFPGKVYRRTR